MCDYISAWAINDPSNNTSKLKPSTIAGFAPWLILTKYIGYWDYMQKLKMHNTILKAFNKWRYGPKLVDYYRQATWRKPPASDNLQLRYDSYHCFGQTKMPIRLNLTNTTYKYGIKIWFYLTLHLKIIHKFS